MDSRGEKPSVRSLEETQSRPQNSTPISADFVFILDSLLSTQPKYQEQIIYPNMGSIFSSSKSREEIEIALSNVKEIVNSKPVVVFSKTYCGYCVSVKNLFAQLGVSYQVHELNQESDGDDMQLALAEWTGQRTVPNVFIGGKHIGGCDNVTAKHQRGELVPLLTEVGVMPKTTVQQQ